MLNYKRLQLIKERANATKVSELRRTDGTPVAPETGVDGIAELDDYSDRGPGDVVLSGPLLGLSMGYGRTFSTPEAAYDWARGKYGEDRVRPIVPENEEVTRWAVLVKNLRK